MFAGWRRGSHARSRATLPYLSLLRVGLLRRDRGGERVPRRIQQRRCGRTLRSVAQQRLPHVISRRPRLCAFVAAIDHMSATGEQLPSPWPSLPE